VFEPLDSRNVLPNLLWRRAQETPERLFLIDIDGGASHTLQEFQVLVDQWHRVLVAAGVEPGQAVTTLLPNGADAIAVWVAASYAGAAEAPVNPAYTGNLLTHMIRVVEARVVVTTAQHLDAVLAVVAETQVQRIIVADEAEASARYVGDVEVVSIAEACARAADASVARVSVQPWSLSCIIYTSGTTGPSKGVRVSWAQVLMSSTGCFPPEDLDGDDHWYIPYPLFHMSGKLCVYGAVLLGSRAIVRRSFSLSNWWSDIDEHSCTTALMIGAVPQLVSGRPVSDGDAQHALRNVLMAPMPENARELEARFGFRLTTVFNMTEVSVPVHTGWAPGRAGSVGRIRDGYQVRIVDEHDLEVPAGHLGEITVRSDIPWVLHQGYWGMPEKTVEAWRNGWFHTGDAGYVDADGWFYFVDRIKDAIRKGGENISSMELEAEIAEHPQVRECAAVGVPSELGEEDVLVFVVPESGEPDLRDLHTFCIDRLPKFMVPRYFVIIDALPKTPTEKVRKGQLKERLDGLPRWDAVAERG
jgi:carnitine-CoA ligase